MAVKMGVNLYSRYVRPTWERLRSGGRIKLGSKVTIASGAKLDISNGGSIRLGRRSSISHGAILATYGGIISLGDRVSVNPYTILYGHGGLTIGDNVRIAAHTVIVPSNHRFDDPTRPIKNQGMSQIGITIEDDVWIGANVVVLDGSTIGRGCVVGAGSVVRGRLEPNGIYVGSPARRVGCRGAVERTDGVAP